MVQRTMALVTGNFSPISRGGATLGRQGRADIEKVRSINDVVREELSEGKFRGRHLADTASDTLQTLVATGSGAARQRVSSCW